MTKYLRLKRFLDLLASVIGLIILLPLFLVLALVIKIDSPGPVFFRQLRYKKGREHFQIIKFRTMRKDAPNEMPTRLLEDPERWITRSGRFLRKSSLDELPQIINIIKGDMSFIGPRPVILKEYDLILERDKYGANQVPVGLTGWAQINGRDELNVVEKAKLDGDYVKKIGLLMDFKCLLKTIHVCLKPDQIGASDPSVISRTSEL